MRIVTLVTDFGLHDWFVGTMKGVLSQLAARCQVVDITHAVDPGDIWGAAFALAAAAPYFPAGSVHLAVVDPGVGSERGAVAIRTRSADYVGPDNGVLSLALRSVPILAIHRIENHRLCLNMVSHTFHGRDVFAPVAAHLANGRPLKAVGPRVSGFLRLPWPEPEETTMGWRGVVVYLDRFGNGITNLPSSLIPSRPGVAPAFRIGRRRLKLHACYADVSRGEPLVVEGSSGLLEVAVNGGSAARKLRLRRGTPVELLRQA